MDTTTQSATTNVMVEKRHGLGNQQPSIENMNVRVSRNGRPPKSKGIDPSDKAYPHGTASGYRYCKCEACRQCNSDRKRELNAMYRQRPGHKARQRALNLAHKRTDEGRAMRRAHHAARKAAMRLSGLPKDVRDLIVRIYKACPIGYQVDHDTPISAGGKHLPENLQYLPADVNNAKRAKLDHDVSAFVIRWQDVLDEGSTTIPQGSRAKRLEVPRDQQYAGPRYGLLSRESVSGSRALQRERVIESRRSLNTWQKRMQHELRLIALQQLRGGIPLFDWQRNLVAMAGSRGVQDDVSWVLPLATDPEFLAQMVNAPRAPTYNRHFVVNGSTLTQGGQQLGSIASTDVFKLSHADDISEIIQEATMRVLPVNIPGDEASEDDPIKAVMLHDSLSWSRLIRETTTGANLRQWQADAMKRAEYGNLRAHPLFAPGSFMWNNVLHRRMGDFGIRFLASTVTKHISAANRYSAAETDVTVNAGLGAGYQVARSLVLGAQALACCNGVNSESGVPYTMLENKTNFQRNNEMAGEVIGGCDKLTFGLPDGQGNLEPTDIGVIVVDSVVPRLSV